MMNESVASLRAIHAIHLAVVESRGKLDREAAAKITAKQVYAEDCYAH